MIFLIACAVVILAQFVVVVGYKLYRRRVEVFAARTRGEITGPLVDLLSADVDARARDEFLARIPHDPRARQIVADLLLETMPKLRGSARDELAELFDEAGFTAQYLHGLSSPQYWQRAGAAQALGDLYARRAASDLANLLADSEPSVRVVAARALGKLGMPEAVDSLIQAHIAGALASGPVAASILRIGHAAGTPLMEYLRHDAPEARALAARLLGLLDFFQAGPALAEALHDEHAGVRAEAARSVGRLGVEQVSLPLMQALSDDHVEVRIEAATALGQGEDYSVAGVLRLALSDDVYEMRRAAAEALVALGAPGIERLMNALRNGDALARAHAVEALERSEYTERMMHVWLEAQPGAPLQAADSFLRALAAAGGRAPFEAEGIYLESEGRLSQDARTTRRIASEGGASSSSSRLASVTEE